MVAASSDRSNVPPDHLEAAPLLTFAAITANEFGVRSHIAGFDAQPGQARQNQAARAQPGRLPGAVPALALDVPPCSDPQAAASRIALPECLPLTAAQGEPCRGQESLELDGDRQQRREPEAGHAQNSAAQQYETAQSRVRPYFDRE
jgi:hypothetical protein